MTTSYGFYNIIKFHRLSVWKLDIHRVLLTCYHPRVMRLSNFDYHLPEELIAQFPQNERSGSRLLGLLSSKKEPKDLMFTDLPVLLQPGDLLVLNDTRVMRARLYGKK